VKVWVETGNKRVFACTHGDLTDELLHRLQMRGFEALRPTAAKGSMIVVDHDGYPLADARYFPPPA
jgi:hypothetical protein